MAERETLPDVSREKTEEEYLSAQRAAAEAIDVGRETVMVASVQKEQVENAYAAASEAEYALEKSMRVLRGMTWSGWVQNMFTKDVASPSTDEKVFRTRNYEVLDAPYQAAGQAILNYRCNVVALATCQTIEQRNICLAVCDSTYNLAAEEIAKLELGQDGRPRDIVADLAADLSMVKDMQSKTSAPKGDAMSATHPDHDLSKQPSVASPTLPSQHEPAHIHKSHQDEHLNNLSSSLGELNSLGRCLGQLMTDQNELLESVSDKADSNLDNSKLVTRRANRLVQKKAWKPVPKEFHAWYSIQHAATGSFLSVADGSLTLSKSFRPDSCIFGVWKKQGNMIGLQHRSSKQWVGQTLLGYLACKAKSFGTREEWETYDDWEETRLCCTTANWGAGGFLISQQEGILSLSANASEKNAQADRWRLTQEDV